MDGSTAGFLLLVVGALSVVGALVGGDLQLGGSIQFPVMKSRTVRIVLVLFGVSIMFIGLMLVLMFGALPGVQPNSPVPQAGVPTSSPPTAPPETVAPPPAPPPEPTAADPPATAPQEDPDVALRTMEDACQRWVPELNTLAASIDSGTVDIVSVQNSAAQMLYYWYSDMHSLPRHTKHAHFQDQVTQAVYDMHVALSSAAGATAAGDVAGEEQSRGEFNAALGQYHELVSSEDLPTCQQL